MSCRRIRLPGVRRREVQDGRRLECHDDQRPTHQSSGAVRRASSPTRGTWLAAVAVVFTVAQLVLVRPDLGLGWDETVYVSQVSGHVPAAYFSAPRSRGISLLAAPIASWSDSTVLLRIYLAVLSGLALCTSPCVSGEDTSGPASWRCAGALFASLWVTLFYGPQAMPNYWVAIGALTCVGCILRARANACDRAAWWGVFAGAGVMAWMRPMDAVYVVLPLLVLALRRPRLLAVLAVGLMAGAGEWVIEAYVSYGGLGQRLSEASAIQGGLGWHLAFVDQLRGLGGRTLSALHRLGPKPGGDPVVVRAAAPRRPGRGGRCPRPARAARSAPGGVRRHGRCPLSLPHRLRGPSVPAARLRPARPPRRPRPGPPGDRTARGTARTLAASLVAVGLAGHLAVQYVVLEHTVHSSAASRLGWARTAAALHALGVRQPCLLSGYDAVPIAYYTGCGSAQTAGHDASISVAELMRAAHRTSFAVLAAPGRRAPAYARTWPDERVGVLQAYVAPDAQRGR